MKVIPAIDLRGGHCVRLRQGDFDHETIYSDDPLRVARGYRDGGFTQLHIVDLDGARQGRQAHQALVRGMVGTGLEVQLGGGVRDRQTLAEWLRSGVARCVIGSLAASEPQTVAAWIEEFGSDAIVLAFDVRTGDGADPLLATHGWTRSGGATLWQSLDRFRPAGLPYVLCTDVARDGMMNGPNIALYRECLERYPEIRVQASGGVRDLDDLAALRDAGCAAAITGRALLDASLAPSEVVSFLRGA